jgi:hypothetical protein
MCGVKYSIVSQIARRIDLRTERAGTRSPREFGMENATVLETEERAWLVADLLREPAAAVPDSDALSRGSLAEGCDDPYSDIDLLWEVPDDALSPALTDLPAILVPVRPVAALRFDPDFQHSVKRRLMFLRFAGVSLFSRIDAVAEMDPHSTSLTADAGCLIAEML